MLEYLYNRPRPSDRDAEAADRETLLTEEKGGNQSPSPSPSPPPSSSQRPENGRNLAKKHLVFLLWPISIVAAVVAGVFLGRGSPAADVDRSCTNHISQYSPLLKDVSISYDFVEFEGSLMHENIFRQNGSPEVDAAWESLGIDYRHIVVPDDLAEKSGLRQEQVQVAEKYGGGYLANVEGLHHLHCLNLDRKALYYNFEYYDALGEAEFTDDKRILKYHVSHCLDIIRQQLMCTVDIAVLGQVWWNKATPIAFPDFNTKHICRNYEEVRSWAEEHQAPIGEPRDYLKPPKGPEEVLAEMP